MMVFIISLIDGKTSSYTAIVGPSTRLLVMGIC